MSRFIQSFSFPFLALLVIVFTFQSCEPPKPGLRRNSEIESDKRAKFHQMIDDVLSAMQQKRPDLIENMMSKELLDQGVANKVLEERLGLHTKSGKYHFFDEFYLVSKFRGSTEIKSAKGTLNEYTMTIPVISPEMYIGLIIPNQPGEKWMMTVIYSKLAYGWRISSLEINQFTCINKTAPQLYKLAQVKLNKGYLVDAVNTLQLATKCLRPNDYWQYDRDLALTSLFSELQTRANQTYRFPYTITAVPTQPKIFNVINLHVDEGTFPMIYYKTSIPLKNIDELTEENLKIRKAIGKVMPGIDKDKEYLLFEAYNNYTTVSKTMPSVEFKWKIGE